jgi:hypothetical protein
MASAWKPFFCYGFDRASVEASGEALGKALPKGPLKTVKGR